MHFKALMTVAQSLDGEAGKKKRAKAFILTHCRVPTYQLQVNLKFASDFAQGI